MKINTAQKVKRVMSPAKITTTNRQIWYITNGDEAEVVLPEGVSGPESKKVLIVGKEQGYSALSLRYTVEIRDGMDETKPQLSPDGWCIEPVTTNEMQREIEWLIRDGIQYRLIGKER